MTRDYGRFEGVNGYVEKETTANRIVVFTNSGNRTGIERVDCKNDR